MEDEDGYLLFASARTNAPIVSRALGAVLKAQRESVELMPEGVAYRDNINTAYLCAVENGRRLADILAILSICEVAR